MATSNANATPHKLRRHKIVTRTLLILFIVVNFAFGAPVAAPEKLEGGIDVDVTEDGTAALQKRVNPVDEGSTNMAGQTPSSPDRTEVDQLWQETRKQGIPIDSPTPPQTPGWSTLSFGEESSTGSNSRPLSPERSPPGSIVSNLLPLSHTPPPKELLPQALSLTTDTLLTTDHKSTPKQSSGPGLGVHPPQDPKPRPPAAAEMPVDEFLDMLMNGKTKPPNPAQSPPNAGPHPHAAAEMPSDESLDIPVKGKGKRPNQVQLPVGPPHPLPNPVHPPVKPPLNPGSNPRVADKMPIDEFLDMLMKGKIKRAFLSLVL